MALLANLLLPGLGLILLRREWLGLSISLLFAAAGNFSIAGAWIAPDSFPRWLVWIGWILAIAVWLLAQWMLVRHRKALAARRSQVRALVGKAAALIQNGELAAAQSILEEALLFDAEDSEAAELRTRLGVHGRPAMT
ncbi:MAG TPA: tetratricopeptide repeat protein [Phycisphaerae bacterium]|nr:tetratricopeptide repeat protein [Phycisphaerae bacterium]